MTLLALLRHAPTAWNRDGRMQGRADVPLSEEGRARYAALRLPPAVAGFAVRVSPLGRARETAALLGVAAETDARLIEMDWGRYEGRTLAELRAAEGAALAANEARGLDFRPPGGESPREVQVRVAPLLAEIATAGAPTLCITHRGVIRAVYAWARAWPLTGKPPDRLASAAVQIFALDGAGVPRLHSLNLALEER